jgi:hypothetical protein
MIGDLKSEIKSLEKRFLDPWLPAQPGQLPSDFEYDVKAYCVLAHAAFEEFVEEVSSLALKLGLDSWWEKKFSLILVSLISTYGLKIKVMDSEDKMQDRVTDQIREGISECKKKHSAIIKNNHGFSLKYLRAILTPVGIDIPESVKLLESLNELAEARGSFAHSKAQRALYGRIEKAARPMVPEKAKETVNDCLELCSVIFKRYQRMAGKPIERGSDPAWVVI